MVLSGRELRHTKNNPYIVIAKDGQIIEVFLGNFLSSKYRGKKMFCETRLFQMPAQTFK